MGNVNFALVAFVASVLYSTIVFAAPNSLLEENTYSPTNGTTDLETLNVLQYFQCMVDAYGEVIRESTSSEADYVNNLRLWREYNSQFQRTFSTWRNCGTSKCLSQAGATTFKFYRSFSTSVSQRVRTLADRIIATQCVVQTKLNEIQRQSLLQYYICVIDAHNEAADRTHYDDWQTEKGVFKKELNNWQICKTRKCTVDPAVRIHKLLEAFRSCEKPSRPNQFVPVADQLIEQNCFDIQENRYPTHLAYFGCVADAQDNAVMDRDLGERARSWNQIVDARNVYLTKLRNCTEISCYKSEATTVLNTLETCQKMLKEIGISAIEEADAYIELNCFEPAQSV